MKTAARTTKAISPCNGYHFFVTFINTLINVSYWSAACISYGVCKLCGPEYMRCIYVGQTLATSIFENAWLLHVVVVVCGQFLQGFFQVSQKLSPPYFCMVKHCVAVFNDWKSAFVFSSKSSFPPHLFLSGLIGSYWQGWQSLAWRIAQVPLLHSLIKMQVRFLPALFRFTRIMGMIKAWDPGENQS